MKKSELRIIIKEELQLIIEGDNYQIFCDMDGVLTDFDKAYTKASNGIPPTKFRNTYGRDKFWAVINPLVDTFWSQLEWMPGGKQLWKYIKPHYPIILSAFPKVDNRKLVVVGKKKWLQSNIGSTPYQFEKKEDKKTCRST